MLDLLTKSKIRRRIILQFIYNQHTEFYLSEVARLAKTSVGTAQRELNRLVDIDLITFKKKANLNIYALNKQFGLLREVESIVLKTIGIDVELKREMEGVENIVFAFLFGSYAKEGLKSDSDIDLFIIGEPEENLVFEIIQKVEEKINREINYYISDQKEFLLKKESSHFYNEIIGDCVLIAGDENEFRKFIE